MRRRDVIQAQYQYKAALEGLCRLIGADLTPALRSTEICFRCRSYRGAFPIDFCLLRRRCRKRCWA